MIVLVTGSTGFVGKNLCQILSSIPDIDLFVTDRKGDYHSHSGSTKNLERFRNFDGKIKIVNLAGASGKDRNVLESANLQYSKKILLGLDRDKLQYDWIQASSFFQLYKKFYGVDKDLYSKTKDQALTFLRDCIASENLFNFYFPHTFGKHEKSSRLVPQLRHAKAFRKSLALASGKNVIPLLPVQLLVSYLKHVILGSVTGDEFALLQTPVVSVREISRIILNEDLALARFGVLDERENEFYDEKPFLDLHRKGRKMIELKDLYNELLG